MTSNNFQELSASNNYTQSLDTLPSFWRSGNFSQSATSAQTNALDSHYDFISFLAVAQRLKIDFLPITWQPALDRVGEGTTAEICQSLINLRTSFAFKRFKWSLDESSNFRALISEILVLGNPLTRNHPNIIRLEGICWDIPPGDVKVHPVLVFEKTQYGDLEQFVDSATGSEMELQDRLKLCVDTGAAILAMHSNHIIHGDIKPQNVLVFEEEPGKFVARVADFGYSTQFVSHNPLYMPKSWPWNAPEHHHRGFKPSEAVKMDIYSFGMLCLWFLFKERLSETIPQEVLGDRRGLNDEEKGTLHELFNSSLICDPDERSSDLEHLLRLLSPRVTISHNIQLTKCETPLLHEDFQIAPSLRQLYGADYRVRSYIATCLEERVFHSTRKYCREESCLRKAVFQLAFCYKLGFGIKRDDKKSQVLLEQSVRQHKDLEHEFDILRQGWPVSRFQEVNINNLDFQGYIRQFRFGQHYRLHQLLDTVEWEYRREIADVESVIGEAHSIVTILRSTLASIFRDQGRWSEAEELDAQLMETRKKEPRVEFPDMMSITHNLAVDLINQGKYEAAEEMYSRVVESMTEAKGIKHPDTLGSINNLALAFYIQGKFQAAEATHSQALQEYEKALGRKHIETIASMNNMALALQGQRKYIEAEELYRQVLELCEESLGKEHPDALASMNNLALLLQSQCKYEGAEELHRRTLKSRERVLGNEHPSTLSTVNNLALVLDQQGSYEAAEKLHRRAFEGFRKVLGNEHPDTLQSVNNLASVLHKQRDHRGAEEMYRCAVDMHQKALGKEHPYTIMSMSELALVLVEQGKMEAAQEMFQRALEQGRGRNGGNIEQQSGNM